MRGGRIEHFGTAREIYERPASAFVATFIGTTNLVLGTIEAPPDSAGRLRLSTAPGPAFATSNSDQGCGDSVLLAIRPERLKLVKSHGVPPDVTAWPAEVTRVIYLGARIEVQLRLHGGSPAVSYLVNEGELSWTAGDTGIAWFRPEDAWIVPPGFGVDGPGPHGPKVHPVGRKPE